MEGKQPIFVVGRNRSGTKWLSNILANHDAVAAVQHPKGRWSGIVETNIFDRFPALFGDLSNKENRYGFLACFAETNFFRFTGVPKSALYSYEQDDYLDLFDALMAVFAERRGKQIWLQKSYSLLLPRLHSRFPHAKFVIIRRRNVLDNIRSNLAKQADKEAAARVGPSRVVREVFSYYLHRAVEERYEAEPNVMLVYYEDLKGDTANVVEKVCAFCGLSYSPSLLNVGYQANTSFKRGVRREDVLSSSGLRVFRLCQALARTIPAPLLRGLNSSRGTRAPRSYSARRFIRGTFRDLMTESREMQAKAPAAGETDSAGNSGGSR